MAHTIPHTTAPRLKEENKVNAIYIDGFSLIGGLTDIKVDLQTSTPMLDENNNVVGEERALAQRITLSMPMAKELAEKLAEMVSVYEQHVGPVMRLDEIRAKLSPEKK